MTTEPLTYTVGDTAPALSGTVNADLTGATLEVHVRRPDATVITKTATSSDESATSSTWTAEDWAVDDLSVVGRHLFEVEVTFAGGAVQTFVLDSDGLPAEFFVRNQYA
jgi:hypothetical protein